MLAVCTGLLIVNTLSRLPQGVQAPAAQKEPRYAEDHSAGTIPTEEDFRGWNLQHKSQYCSQNLPEKTPAHWAQEYLCGAKYTDNESALSSVRIVYLTFALVGVGCAQLLVYFQQSRIMKRQAEISAQQAEFIQQQTILDKRPKLVVRHMSLDVKYADLLDRDKNVEPRGRFLIVKSGGTTAHVEGRGGPEKSDSAISG